MLTIKEYIDNILLTDINIKKMKAISYLQKEMTKEFNELREKIKIDSEYTPEYVGWQYFNEVCYLSKEQQNNFLLEKKKTYFTGADYNIFFNEINYLQYLTIEIRHIKKYIKAFRRDRAELPPTKEILSILRYIGDNHSISEPLVELLAGFKDDFSSDCLSYKNKMLYISKKENTNKVPPPTTNYDDFNFLKNEYKKSIKNIYTHMKNHNPRDYKKPTETLLLNVDIVLKPSDI